MPSRIAVGCTCGARSPRPTSCRRTMRWRAESALAIVDPPYLGRVAATVDAMAATRAR
ncbi:hypothetical protein [Rhodanobacter fulvus]|uniref:hypothetical protein n=1 Tax=Rhodanobacter fulvus TaxID=219571 RepID=UPI0012EA5564|nr:hypothetical protein [Rhodanobacter fulvus]